MLALAGAGPIPKPAVISAMVIAGPNTLNASASPAPVPANRSFAARVTVTVTKDAVVWINCTVPNGPVPQVPVQPSVESVIVVAFAGGAAPSRLKVIKADNALKLPVFIESLPGSRKMGLTAKIQDGGPEWMHL